MLSMYLAFIDSEEDKDLFITLYETYKTQMIQYAQSILSPNFSAYAEDVVQEAFITLAKHIDKIKGQDGSKKRAFIVCIVRSRAIDFIRKRNHITIPLEEKEPFLESDDPAPIDKVISNEGYQYLKQCIREMGDTYRDALELKLSFKLTDDEIGSILGISPKAANLRVYRGKVKLKQMLLEKGV